MSEKKPFRLDVTKEWCERMANLEDGCEVGAGSLAQDPFTTGGSQAHEAIHVTMPKGLQIRENNKLVETPTPDESSSGGHSRLQPDAADCGDRRAVEADPVGGSDTARLQQIQERQHEVTSWHAHADRDWMLKHIDVQALALRTAEQEADRRGIALEKERSLLVDAEDALRTVREERDLSHQRLNECAGWETTKHLSLYERISKKIEQLSNDKSETEHTLKACSAEMDVLRGRAEAAEHRRAAAEYRAQRIVLDAELKAENASLRADVARLTAERDMFKDRYEDYENREAACCPEDFGFEEVIASRTKRAEHAEQQAHALQEGIEQLVEKWQQEATAYITGSMLPSPVGDMNLASADVVRKILQDIRATLHAAIKET